MSEELSGPKELREAYDRAKAELADLRTFKRNTILEKAGVPEKAHGFVTKALGDDADWDSPDAIKSLLTEQGLAFGDVTPSGESAGGPPITDEDRERLNAQSRLDDMRSAGAPPSGAPKSIKDQIAEATAAGDHKTAMALKSQQMLEAQGVTI